MFAFAITCYIHFGAYIFLLLDIESVRLMPASGFLMNELVVTSPINGEYKVELYPVNCSYPFSDMTTRNGPDNSVFHEKSASPPVKGTFDISYESYSVEGKPAMLNIYPLLSEFRVNYGNSSCSITDKC